MCACVSQIAFSVQPLRSTSAMIRPLSSPGSIIAAAPVAGSATR